MGLNSYIQYIHTLLFYRLEEYKYIYIYIYIIIYVHIYIYICIIPTRGLSPPAWPPRSLSGESLSYAGGYMERGREGYMERGRDEEREIGREGERDTSQFTVAGTCTDFRNTS